jgi:hypothetical protein
LKSTDETLDSVAKLTMSIERDLALDTIVLGKEYDYASLAHCFIDAIFSMGVKYPSVTNVVTRWCAKSGWECYRSDPSSEHTVTEYLAAVHSYSDQELAETVFDNRCRTSIYDGGILKAGATRLFAGVLHRHGIDTIADMRQHMENPALDEALMMLPGQTSGICLRYFKMLAGGANFIKPDRWICRYVAAQTGETTARKGQRTPEVSPARAEALLLAAIAELQQTHPTITPRLVDYAIWSKARRRPGKKNDAPGGASIPPGALSAP